MNSVSKKDVDNSEHQRLVHPSPSVIAQTSNQHLLYLIDLMILEV